MCCSTGRPVEKGAVVVLSLHPQVLFKGIRGVAGGIFKEQFAPCGVAGTPDNVAFRVSHFLGHAGGVAMEIVGFGKAVAGVEPCQRNVRVLLINIGGCDLVIDFLREAHPCPDKTGFFLPIGFSYASTYCIIGKSIHLEAKRGHLRAFYKLIFIIIGVFPCTAGRGVCFLDGSAESVIGKGKTVQFLEAVMTHMAGAFVMTKAHTTSFLTTIQIRCIFYGRLTRNDTI